MSDIFDTESSAARLEWMKARVDNIHKSVSVYDVLSKNGIHLAKHGRQEEQISCPFHGSDKHPSARYFPDAESRSHVWCFVCQENWDAIGMWKKFSGTEKFSEVLFEIEKEFHLTVPESNLPRSIIDPSNPLREEVDRILSACEYRLRTERGSFEMVTHLKFGNLLDQIHYSLSSGKAPLEEVKIRLDLILQKMGRKFVPRRLKILSPEMGGTLELYLIYSYGGIWEEEWHPLQKVSEMDLPAVSKEVMDQALVGWTKPLVRALGPEPKGKLRLLPRPARQCANRATCPLFDRDRCGALLKRMPWCFEPDGLEEKALAAEIIKMWRDEVYVVIVQEGE